MFDDMGDNANQQIGRLQQVERLNQASRAASLLAQESAKQALEHVQLSTTKQRNTGGSTYAARAVDKSKVSTEAQNNNRKIVPQARPSKKVNQIIPRATPRFHDGPPIFTGKSRLTGDILTSRLDALQQSQVANAAKDQILEIEKEIKETSETSEKETYGSKKGGSGYTNRRNRRKTQK